MTNHATTTEAVTTRAKVTPARVLMAFKEKIVNMVSKKSAGKPAIKPLETGSCVLLGR